MSRGYTRQVLHLTASLGCTGCRGRRKRKERWGEKQKRARTKNILAQGTHIELSSVDWINGGEGRPSGTRDPIESVNDIRKYKCV